MAEETSRPDAATGGPQPDAKPKAMTQTELVVHATNALDKSLEATIPDAALRQAAVEKAGVAFAEALKEGLKDLPAGASLKPEKAAEIISDIYKLQAENAQWDGKKGDKPVADIVKEASQEFALESEAKRTLGDRLKDLAGKAGDNPGWAALGAGAATLAASKLVPNKETEQPDGTVTKKMGFIKKAVITVGAIATAVFVAKKMAPEMTGKAMEAVSDKWREYVTNRKPAAAAAQGPAV